MYLAVGLARHDCLTGCGLAKKESALKLRYPGLRSDLRALISFTGFLWWSDILVPCYINFGGSWFNGSLGCLNSLVGGSIGLGTSVGWGSC